MRRVVVSGIGVVAPNGVGKDAFWAGCVEGHSGIGPIRSFDASNHPIRVAGEDTAGVVVAAASALALAVAGLWLQHCCKSPEEPPDSGDAAPE